MLSISRDANRICRLLGYTRHILVIIMVREINYFLLKVCRCVEHTKIYKVLQRSYKVRFIYFFIKSKSFYKVQKFCKSLKVLESLKVL